MKIILSGGGTLGSVSPLVAVWQEIKDIKPGTDTLWVGTKNGPEEKFIKNYGIEFSAISSGKLRRYFSWKNFVDPFLILAGFFQSIKIINRFKPNIVVSAGGFVSVPIIWAAHFKKIPILIHQQDIKPGLANKLTAKKAKKITVTFEKSLQDFPQEKTTLTGNPVRIEILHGNAELAINYFKLEKNIPTILIIGGGTGALTINKLVWGCIDDLTKSAQIIHFTGKGKTKNINQPRYHQVEFVTDKVKDIYAICDLVVCRAGMSILSEVANLEKPTIIIPIPNSHQEDNAQEFAKNNAAIYLKQDELESNNFCQAILELLKDEAQLQNLSRNISKVMIKDGRKNVTREIINLFKTR